MATASIQRIHEAIAAEFPTLKGAVGVVVVRPIKYSSSWSQHAWGNATDYYGPAAELERLYHWLVKRRRILPIGTVCYNFKGGCTTSHKDHLHVDATPKLTGTPPASGSIPSPSPDRPSQADFDKPGPSDSDIIAFITGKDRDPDLALRSLLLIGGAALILIGVTALVLPTGIDLASVLPGPAGNVARVGKSIGGST